MAATDWPADEAKKLHQHLTAIVRDEDLASTVLLAALSRPWEHVRAAAGARAYAAGILRHKEEDRHRAAKHKKALATRLAADPTYVASEEMLPDHRKRLAKLLEAEAERRKLDRDGLPVTSPPLPTSLPAAFEGPAPRGAHIVFPDSQLGRIRDPAGDGWLSPADWPYPDRYVLTPSGHLWLHEAFFRVLRPPIRTPPPAVEAIIRRAQVLSDKLRQAATDLAANLGPPSQRQHLGDLVNTVWAAALGFDKPEALVNMEFIDALFGAARLATLSPEVARNERELGLVARDLFARKHPEFALRLDPDVVGKLVDAWRRPTRDGVPRWAPTRALLVALHNPEGGDDIAVPSASSLEKMWKKHHALRHPEALGA
ncbi:MAG: hypothetical protein QM765_16500 [Myxococcales bacterium]